MKITQVVCQILRSESVIGKTASCQDSLLVRVRAEDGTEGFGEADSSPEVVKAIIDAPFSHNIACGLRHVVLGESVFEIERLWEKMYQATLYFGRTGVTITAMAAIDMALWDLKGKLLQQPIHQMLGGKRHDQFRAYASILFGQDGVATQNIGAKQIDAGYTAVKFGWEPMGESEAMDRELVAGARAGLGPDATLLVDAGCVWDERTALQRAQMFADYDIGWLEEPLRPDNVEGYRWVRDRSPVPIAAGEQECGRESFRPFIEQRALDVYQIDLARNGFTDANYLRERIAEIGARPCNHCYTSPVTLAASLHWLSTCRDAFLFEDCVEEEPIRQKLTHERVQATDGFIIVPDGPGLGVTLNEDFIQTVLVDQSE